MLNEENPKVLVVNDDPNSLLGLIALLSSWEKELNYEILPARSGQEALRQVLFHDFAAILLDVNMPGMDGFETAEAIHLRQRSSSTPIIFVTAFHADEINRFKGYQKGAVDYLFTPIIPEVLKAKLSVFVGLSKKNLQLKHQTEILDKRTKELESINARLQFEIKEREIAEQENKQKDRFLAMLGHELRNPLSAITTAATLLNITNAKPEKIEYAKQVIHRQSQHLSHIVDDLLDLSRIMSGKIVLDKKPLDLSRLVKSCIETLGISGRTQNHEFTVNTDQVWINGDPTRIEQIVTNLLDNALKYTPPRGAITVDVHAAKEMVELTVRDSGMGIPGDLLPRVFDVFTQGEQTVDRAQGGLGIGLALVRQLIELHGGSVCAKSAGTGQGSTFVVRLPRTAGQGAVGDIMSPAACQQNYRLLLIEDNHDAREMLSLLLSSLGHTVKQAKDGHEGLRAAMAEPPDLILVDIGLPELDGHEVARRLKADPLTRGIPLIALTGYGLDKDRQQAIAAGFHAHLTKPVSMADLIKVMESCLPSLAKV